MGKLDLTVVVVSFNTKKETKECLRKLSEAKKYSEKKLGNKVTLIVVDNASSDGSREMIKKNFKVVNLIGSDTNLGFAKANNLAVKKVNTPYILLLNPDTFIYKTTLYEAVSYLQANAGCDVLGIKLTYEDGRFQPAGGSIPTPLKTILWLFGIESLPVVNKLIKPIYIHNKKFYSRERRMGWLTGSFMMLKKKVYTKTKGFDDSIFLYMEDVEWCKRINDLGYTICYTPAIKAVHLEGSSSKKLGFDNTLEKQTKGLLYYQNKHYPKSLFFVMIAAKYGYMLRYLYYLFTGEQERAVAYLRVGRSIKLGTA